MGIAVPQGLSVPERVRRTVALLEERGYGTTPARLGSLCLGGPLSEREVRAAAAWLPDLELVDGLLVTPALRDRAAACRARARRHPWAAAAFVPEAVRFAERVVQLCPFVLGVAIAGSLASGGFVETDDVDLNLLVEDGRRHLAYLAVNLLGYLHALRHRKKPVDAGSRRPLAPRVMTVNLVLERSQCFPLARQDEQMALELLQSEPVCGAELFAEVVAANPRLTEHFPQLRERPAPLARRVARRLPADLFPALLDGPAKVAGEASWRWLQWTRRGSPEALARVALVRETMRPYTLFDR